MSETIGKTMRGELRELTFQSVVIQLILCSYGDKMLVQMVFFLFSYNMHPKGKINDVGVSIVIFIFEIIKANISFMYSTCE